MALGSLTQFKVEATLSWELVSAAALTGIPWGVLRLPDGATFLPSLFAVSSDFRLVPISVSSHSYP